MTHKSERQDHTDGNNRKQIRSALLHLVLRPIAAVRLNGVERIESVRDANQSGKRTDEGEHKHARNKHHGVRLIVRPQPQHQQCKRRQDSGDDKELELVFGLGDAAVLARLPDRELVGDVAAEDGARHGGDEGGEVGQADVVGLEVVWWGGEDTGAECGLDYPLGASRWWREAGRTYG